MQVLQNQIILIFTHLNICCAYIQIDPTNGSDEKSYNRYIAID